MKNIKTWTAVAAVVSALALPQAVRADDDLAVAAIRNHDWVMAEQQLQASLRKEPGNAVLQLNLAWVYAQTGRKTEAATLYREILRHEKDYLASHPARDSKSLALLAEKGLALLKNN